MNAKMIRCALAALMVLGAPALATLYEWTGAGANDEWDNYQNWDCGAACDPTSYPSTTNDDAIVDTTDTINLTDETIDDLSIDNPGSNDGPTFDGQDSELSLTCDTITISGGGSYYTEVTLTGEGIISTN